MRKRTALTVASLDSLTGLLGSIFNFFDHRTLLGHPDLAVLALLAWSIPLSAILPPATLCVVNVNQPETKQLQVPAINFTIRLLGVQVDSKLQWGPHIRTTAVKGTLQMQSL
jgi:hypothetical protein